MRTWSDSKRMDVGRRRGWAAGAIAVLVLSMAPGCRHNIVRRPDIQPKLSVQPQIVCQGDTITIRWDGNLSDDLRDDQHCCQFGYGCVGPQSNCLPYMEGTVSTLPSTLLNPSPTFNSTYRNPFGSTTVTAPADFVVTLDAEGRFGGKPAWQRSIRRDVTVVRTGLPDSHRIILPFFCQGRSWTAVEIEGSQPPYTKVRITGVKNLTSETVVVSLERAGQAKITETLASGRTTTAFNGTPAGTWSGKLTSAFTAVQPPPRCTPTQLQGAWPDIWLELDVECPMP